MLREDRVHQLKQSEGRGLFETLYKTFKDNMSNHQSTVVTVRPSALAFKNSAHYPHHTFLNSV